jgi:cysteine-rich repeat protein
VRTALGSFDERGSNLAIQVDGTIVVAGYSSNGTDDDFAIARYLGSVCGDGLLQSPEQCDDGNQSRGDGCSPGCMLESCGATPVTWCRGQSASGVGLLSLRDDVFDTKDSLIWQWTKGSTTLRGDFGDPTGASDYLLCLYKSTAPRLLLGTAIPAAGTCDGRPCWRAGSSGFKYKNKTLDPDGISQVLLRSGSTGRAKISMRGKGTDLQLPAPPFALPVTVQLERLDSTVCWEATYSAPSANVSGKFKAKGN